jgi:hypothetical protein
MSVELIDKHESAQDGSPDHVITIEENNESLSPHEQIPNYEPPGADETLGPTVNELMDAAIEAEHLEAGYRDSYQQQEAYPSQQQPLQYESAPIWGSVPYHEQFPDHQALAAPLAPASPRPDTHAQDHTDTLYAPAPSGCCGVSRRNNCFAPLYRLVDPPAPGRFPVSSAAQQRVADVRARHAAEIATHFDLDHTDPRLCVVVGATRGLRPVEGVDNPFVRVRVLDRRNGQPITGEAPAVGAPHPDADALAYSTARCRLSLLRPAHEDAQIILAPGAADAAALDAAPEGGPAEGPEDEAGPEAGVRCLSGSPDPDWGQPRAVEGLRTAISDAGARARLRLPSGSLHGGVVCVEHLSLAAALAHGDAALFLEVLDLPAHVPQHQAAAIGRGVGRRVAWAHLRLDKAVNMGFHLDGRDPSLPDTLCEGALKVQLHAYDDHPPDDARVPDVFRQWERHRDEGGRRLPAYMSLFVGGVSRAHVTALSAGVDGFAAGLSEQELQLLLALRAGEHDARVRERLRRLELKRAALLFHTAQYFGRRNAVNLPPPLLQAAPARRASALRQLLQSRAELSVVPTAPSQHAAILAGVRGCSAVAFSAGGRLLAVAGGEAGVFVVRVYEYGPFQALAPGVPAEVLEGLTAGAPPAPTAGEQTQAAAAGPRSDGNLGGYSSRGSQSLHRQWRLLATVAAHRDFVYRLEFSRDGRFLASASSDGFVHLWPVDEGALHGPSMRLVQDPLAQLPPQQVQQQIEARNALASVRAPLQSLWHPGPVYAAAFLAVPPPLTAVAAGEGLEPELVLATGCADGAVRLWRPSSGALLAELRDHADDDGDAHAETGPATGAAAPLRQLLASLTSAAAPLPAAAPPPRPLSRRVTALAAAADGNRFFSADARGCVKQWDLASAPAAWAARFAATCSLHTGAEVTSLALSEPRATLLAHTRNDKVLRLRVGGSTLRPLPPFLGVSSRRAHAQCDVSPCGRYGAAGSDGGAAAVLDLESGAVVGYTAGLATAGMGRRDPRVAGAGGPGAAVPVGSVAWNPALHLLLLGGFGSDCGVRLLEPAHTPAHRLYSRYARAGCRGTDAYLAMRADGVLDLLSGADADADADAGAGAGEQRKADALPALEFKPRQENTRPGTAAAGDAERTGGSTRVAPPRSPEVVHVDYRPAAERDSARERALARIDSRLMHKYGVDSSGRKAAPAAAESIREPSAVPEEGSEQPEKS